MAVAKAVEEVLAAWREAERVLDTLPPFSPDHESVRRTVIDLRRTYRAITTNAEQTTEVIDRTHQTIAAAHEVLAKFDGKSDTTSSDGSRAMPPRIEPAS